MDCQVCNHVEGIPDSLHECPNCHSDLTAIKNIHRLNRDIKTKRNVIIGLAFLLVLMVVFLGYTFLFSDALSSRYTRMEMQAKNNEILELRKKNTELQQTLFDLQQHGDSSEGGTDGEFRKVISSSRGSEGKTQDKDSKAVSVDPISGEKQRIERSQQKSEDQATVTYYRIKAGETLSSVAKREYGDGNTVQEKL
ncbi:MAG: hypothetical protein U5L09_20945 [Bacteroidales bacterium]|nr:hypothetical protein [Bacteroidales bacterium]